MKIKLWQKGDLNGFFGLFVNNLTNIMVMATLLTVTVGLPSSLVYGRILPAVGLAIFLSCVAYTYMAYKLAKKENRNDVTALPCGSSVPHMFLITLMVIGPVYWSTKDANLAWGAGVAWCVAEGIIELLGTFIGEKLRRWIPRAALLGSLAGVSITYIALNPAFATFAIPYIGLVSLVLVLLCFVGNLKIPFNIPVGLVIIVLGVIIGWATGIMTPEGLQAAFDSFTVGYPIPSFMRIIDGLDKAAPFLIAAVPLGIYNFIETIDNCESASVSGDNYNTKQAMFFDGATSIIGGIFGSPFPTAVFLGHPGWKKAGARIGYSLLTGITVLIFTSLGVISLLLSIIPVEAIYPILVFIGISITSQAFSACDRKYASAVVVGMIPHLADWTINEVNIALTAAGSNFAEIGQEIMQAAGLNYLGASALGTGAIIIGIIFGAITVFIIDRKFTNAAIISFAGAILTFFGVIHYNQLSILPNPGMFIGYLAMTVILVGYALLYKYKKELILSKEELEELE
ncbi:MAG: xanthine permease [Bacilli bacterium]|nr:xanthine permease [Bacilli bacterium]